MSVKRSGGPTCSRLALIGGLGHGIAHRRAIHQLQRAGRVRLVAIANRRPVPPVEDAPVDGLEIFDDYRRMLADVKPDVVVIATPPHTHHAIALDAAAMTQGILVEKPPVVSMAELVELTAALHRYGTVCQVGFQALASPALSTVRGAVADGAVGSVTALSHAGAWWRPDGYYRRTPWAGRRMLDGRVVADGAVANQFAHALMQALGLARALTGAADPAHIAVEQYRTRPIEVDDTSCVRVLLRNGLSITMAVTLAAEGFIHGEIAVRGTNDDIHLDFPTDRLRLPHDGQWRQMPGRQGLLANLLDHLDDSRVPLAAALDDVAPFVSILDALNHAPEPTDIHADYLAPHPTGDGRVLVDAVELVREAAEQRSLFSEMALPWARAPWTAQI
ncbi:MAG TPA: Gfo/Idh/MocA family oxidoreductase [Pilimelia sp.]|nr:Gfo/Idh/MocA family oxidoreductase [Pilimelia sp.]